jgi:formylglycine-generating enzyme required for sulfatase activity
MVLLGSMACIDKYEAPNKEGAMPLVMYSFIEAEHWCESRGKRLCYSDEWEKACIGAEKSLWSYGASYQRGMCNDSKTWRKYIPQLLWDWSTGASSPNMNSFGEQLSLVRREQPDSAEHVEYLYQAEPSGSTESCNKEGVYDLLGNVEEWTRRRVPRRSHFSGILKGRFWAETRSCLDNVSNHGDYFRFYETGFRCCLDAQWGN